MVRWKNFEALFARVPKTAKQRVFGWDFHAGNLALALLPSALLVMWLEPTRSQRARLVDDHSAAARSAAAGSIGGGGAAPTRGGGGGPAGREDAGGLGARDDADAGIAAALALRVATLEQRLEDLATELAGHSALSSAAVGDATLGTSATPSPPPPPRGGAAAGAARCGALAPATAAAKAQGAPPV